MRVCIPQMINMRSAKVGISLRINFKLFQGSYWLNASASLIILTFVFIPSWLTMKAALLIEGRDEVLVQPNEIRSFGPEKFLGSQIYLQMREHDIGCMYSQGHAWHHMLDQIQCGLFNPTWEPLNSPRLFHKPPWIEKFTYGLRWA